MLLPFTRFVTLKIDNFYTTVSSDRIIRALGRFLTKVLEDHGRHQCLTIATFAQLTEFVLQNNIFTYNGKIYRYIKGGPLSLPLIRTLENIYLHDWQTFLINKLGYNEEFYGRYYDTIIMSWAPPIERFQPLLVQIKQEHPDLHITATIGYSVQFLDAYVENRKGKLYSYVYHNPQPQPFLLPYVVGGHPRLFYRQWFQWALRRAVRYCTSEEDFEQERLYIEMTLLTLGFPLEFVKMGINLFFQKYFKVTPTSFDHTEYQKLRGRLFTLFELEKKYRKEQLLWKSTNQLIHLHYLYDWGLRCEFNTKFKKLWSDLIKNDPIFAKSELKLKLSTIHCYSLNALLTQETLS